MPKIALEDITPEQGVVIEVFLNEGKMQAYEELLEYLEKEYFIANAEDPYYAYYVKHLIEIVHERYDPLVKETE